MKDQNAAESSAGSVCEMINACVNEKQTKRNRKSIRVCSNIVYRLWFKGMAVNVLSNLFCIRISNISCFTTLNNDINSLYVDE